MPTYGKQATGGTGSGGFGADTIVQLANVATTLVNAWEQVITLTNNGVGTETAQSVLKLISAGAQVNARIDKPGSAWFPNGTSSVPGVGFLGTAGDGTTGSGYGMYFDQTFTRLGFAASANFVTFDGSQLLFNSATGNVRFNDQQIGRIGPNGDMQLTSVHDIVIGSSSALATNATAGFLQIPTCAGTPTGTVAAITGKACLVYDTTNLKLALSVGGGTWKQTAALT
jgi:hypothetical protein